MNEEKNTNKKKILNLYLILAACLLVIAAATITVILAINNADSKLKLDSEVNISGESGEGDNTNDNAGLNSGDNTGDNTIDNSGTNGGNVSDGSNSGDAENANQGGTDDSTNVSTSSELICPVESVDLINSYTFYKNNTLDCYHFHQGLDFAAEQGTCVYAVQGGVIESITTADLLDGTVITIAHDNGLKSCYKFVEVNESLKEGDRVEKGDLIGTVAEANGSEYKDGAHLHFEIYSDGKTIDPENYLDIASK